MQPVQSPAGGSSPSPSPSSFSRTPFPPYSSPHPTQTHPPLPSVVNTRPPPPPYGRGLYPNNILGGGRAPTRFPMEQPGRGASSVGSAAAAGAGGGGSNTNHEPPDVFCSLGSLIVEGRVPKEEDRRGYVEGPHVPQQPGNPQAHRFHECSMDSVVVSMERRANAYNGFDNILVRLLTFCSLHLIGWHQRSVLSCWLQETVCVQKVPTYTYKGELLLSIAAKWIYMTGGGGE